MQPFVFMGAVHSALILLAEAVISLRSMVVMGTFSEVRVRWLYAPGYVSLTMASAPLLASSTTQPAH